MSRRLITERALVEEDDFRSDTTCSTTAHRVQRSLATSTSLSKGQGASTLNGYMGSASSREDGVVYEIQFGQTGMSQHEFVLRQKGRSCMLIQAWLNKIDLGTWLDNHLNIVSTDVYGARLQEVERSYANGDEGRFRQALVNAFGIETSDKDWSREWKMNWAQGSTTMGFTWAAYSAKSV